MAADIFVNSQWIDEAAFNADTAKPAGAVWGSNAFNNLQDAVNAASATEATTITVAAGTYSDDITLDARSMEQKGNIKFIAAEGANVTFTGAFTIGYYEKRVGAHKWDADVVFENITFDQATAQKHSIDIQQCNDFAMINCKVIGDGEYGILGTNVDNGATITGCTFENAGIQSAGNFGTNLLIEDCTFDESQVNIQSGNSVAISGCTFNKTLKGANVGDSFYAVRSNDNAIRIENTVFNIDSDLAEDAGDQAKWGVLWARNAGSTKWDVENIEVNSSDAAMQQSSLAFVKNDTTNANNEAERITVNGLTSTDNNVDELLAKTEGMLNVIDDGTYTKYDDGEVVASFVNSTVYVNKDFTKDNVGEGMLFGFNAFADVNAAAAAAEKSAGKLVVMEGTDVTYTANQWYLLNTPAKEIETDKWSYDYVVDASETYDLQIDGTLKAYQLLLNNAETVVSTTGKLFATGEVLRVMGGSLSVEGVREANAGAPEEIFTGNWGIGTKPGADTQIKGGYIQINQGAVADFNNTVVFVNAGWMNFNDAAAEFNNTYIYLGSGGSYAPIAVELVNGAKVAFADNTTVINDKTFTMNITVDATSTLTLSADSSITATTLTVADGGKFIIDASNFSGYKKVVDLSGASLEGKVTIEGEGVTAIYGEDGDITLSTVDVSTVFVNAEYTGEVGADLGNGKFFGVNAFADFESALAAASKNTAVTRIEIESDLTANGVANTSDYFNISQKLVIGTANGADYKVSIIPAGSDSIAVKVQGDGASLTIEEGVDINWLDVTANGFWTKNEEMVIDGKLSAKSLKIWTSDNGITVNESGKVDLGHSDGQLDFNYGNGFLTVNGNLADTADASLTDGPQFKAGYTSVQSYSDGGELNLNNTYFEGGAWFTVNGKNFTANIDNSVLKVSGGDFVGSLTVNGTGNVFNVENGSRLIVATTTVGANNKIAVDGAALEIGTLTNNGTVEVSGESTLNVTTLSGNTIDLMDGAIVKDSTVGGGVFVAGDVTFRGDNTFGMITDFGTLTDYYGTTAPMAWTVEAGASVTLSNTARYGLGYGDKVVVNGEIAANGAAAARATLTDDDSTNDVKQSLFMHGLVAQESSGWNCDSSFTVNNAFVTIGSNSSFGSKAGNYGGNYTFSFNNSVLNASRITFYNTNAKTTFTLTGSDVEIGQFMTRDQDSVFTLDNTKLYSTSTINGNDEGQYNAGTLNVLNGSTLTYTSAMTNEATGKIVISADSMLIAPEIIMADGASITIDGTNFTGTKKVIDLNGTTSLEGKVTIKGEGLTAIYGADGDVTITDASAETVYFDYNWAGKVAGTEVAAGKVIGVNAFAEFTDNGTNDKGWSNLLVLPEGTTEVVLTAGNENASYGMLRPTQSITVKTDGEGYAVIDRFVNMGCDLTFAEGSKVKVIGNVGLSGANNQGGTVTINGEVYMAIAPNNGNKALYLWGMNGTPGQLVINAGGILKADCANVENHGTITVYGTMELGKLGDAPKLAGVGANNGGWHGHLIVDGKDGEGIVSVAHNQLNFGGGNTSVDWQEPAGDCSVDIINGGKITTAAVSFRNGAKNTLTINNGTLEFTNDPDYANLTPRYFDNQGVIDITDGTLDMSGRKFDNQGLIKLAGESTLTADRFTGNGWIYMNGASLDANSNIVGANVRFASGDNVVDGAVIKDGRFQVGTGLYQTVDPMVDSENGVTVTVKNNAQIGGIDTSDTGAPYGGWIGSAYYDSFEDKQAAMTDARYTLNIENSIANFGYMHVSHDGILNVTGNADEKASYTGVDYSFYSGFFNVNGEAAFDNVDVLTLFVNVSSDNATENPGKLVIKNGANFVSWRDSSTTAETFKISKKGIVEVDNAKLDSRHGTSIAKDAVLTVKNGGEFKGNAVNNDGTITVDKGTVSFVSLINNGAVEVTDGNVTGGSMELLSGFTLDGLTAGEARTITVAFMPEGSTEGGFTKQIEVGKGATSVEVKFTDIADGKYNLNIIDGTNVFSTTTEIVNGTLDINGGKVQLGALNVNSGAANVYGESTVVIESQNGVVNVNDGAVLTDSKLGTVYAYGTSTWQGTNTIGNFSLGWYNAGADIVVNMTGTANVTNFMIYNSEGLTATLNIGSADGERTTINGNQHNYTTNSVVNVVNADVTGNYASMTGVVNITNSTYSKFGDFRVVAGGNTTIDPKVKLDNSSISGAYGYIGGWSASAAGYGVLELVNNSIWQSSGGSCATAKSTITLDNSDMIIGGTFTMYGSLTMDVDSMITFKGLDLGSTGTITIDMTDINNANGNKLFDYTGSNITAWDMDAYKAIIGNWSDDMSKFFTVEDGDLVVKANAVVYVNGSYTDAANNQYKTLEEALASGAGRIITTTDTISSAAGYNGAEAIIQGGTYNGTVSGGSITAGTDYKKDWVDTEGEYSLSISGGTFNKIVMGANRVNAGLSEHVGNVDMTISGGTFNQIVVGGMVYADSSANANRGQAILTGDVNLTISGGTFSKYIYGGNLSGKAEYAGCTMLDGNINITIDAVSAIDFKSGCTLVAGSYRNGEVWGDITVTVKGDGANLTMHDDFQIWGGCSSDVYLADADRTFQSSVSGDRTFVFDEFTGDFDARIRGFAAMEIVGGSEVNITKGNLNDIQDWTLEAGSMLTGNFDNNFAGDDLVIDLGEWSGDSCELMIGAESMFNGIESLASVNVGSDTLTFDGVSKWASASYELELKDGEDGKKVLAFSKLA